MAITFPKERKKQQYLIFVFIGVVLLVGWLIFYKKPRVSLIPPPLAPEPEIIEIDFGVLQNPILQELEVPEEIPAPEEEGVEVGRENPFEPYQTQAEVTPE